MICTVLSSFMACVFKIYILLLPGFIEFHLQFIKYLLLYETFLSALRIHCTVHKQVFQQQIMQQ